MIRLLYDFILYICKPFIDDIGIKGLDSTYKDIEVGKGIRKYVLEYLINLDKTLLNLELGGATTLATKT